MAATATLKITPSENNDMYWVVIFGEGFVGLEGKVPSAVVRGDDEWFDEKLFRMAGPRILDGKFVLRAEVHKNTLNEDWGQDEIYADVTVEGDRNVRTNIVKGKY